MNLTFPDNSACLVHLIACLFYSPLLVSMSCGLLVGEFSEFSCWCQTCLSWSFFDSSLQCFVSFAMQFELLAGEFRKYFFFKWNLHYLFIIWFVCGFYVSVFIGSLIITSKWVYWIVMYKVKLARLVNFPFCLLHPILLISMHLWITSQWVQWISSF